jgi:hypothetical protein
MSRDRVGEWAMSQVQCGISNQRFAAMAGSAAHLDIATQVFERALDAVDAQLAIPHVCLQLTGKVRPENRRKMAYQSK